MNFSTVDIGPVKALIFAIPERILTEQAMAVDESGYGVIGHGVIDFVFIPYSI